MISRAVSQDCAGTHLPNHVLLPRIIVRCCAPEARLEVGNGHERNVLTVGPDTGFGVDLGENDWAAPGLVTSLRKARLSGHRRRSDVQALTDVNNMLFKILATPDR